jgi:hypothetical protein
VEEQMAFLGILERLLPIGQLFVEFATHWIRFCQPMNRDLVDFGIEVLSKRLEFLQQQDVDGTTPLIEAVRFSNQMMVVAEFHVC